MGCNDFTEKAVVITGASAGIGKALALRLAAQGAWLSLAARNGERLEDLARECGRLGGKALAVPTDVSIESQCQNLMQRTRAEFGRLDLLINNAGFAVVGRFEELPDLVLFKKVMDVNFYGTVYCTYYALPHLRESRGHIVNISSLAGKVGAPYNAGYIASKYAMNGFSDSIRMEMAKAGVGVTLICPSWVITEFQERKLDKNGAPRGKAGSAIHTPGMMTADKCAGIILKAAARRKREVIMGPGPLAVWLKLLAPGLIDKLAIRIMQQAAEKEKSGSRKNPGRS